MCDAVADFFDINDMTKTIGGFEKGLEDGVRRRRIEGEIDDMIEGMARNVGGSARGIHSKGRQGGAFGSDVVTGVVVSGIIVGLNKGRGLVAWRDRQLFCWWEYRRILDSGDVWDFGGITCGPRHRYS